MRVTPLYTSVTTSVPNRATSGRDTVSRAAYRVDSPARALARGRQVEVAGVEGKVRRSRRTVAFMVVEVLQYWAVAEEHRYRTVS